VPVTARTRIVVVDDTEHVRTMLVEMLTLDGFEVVGSAVDGAGAVEVVVRTEPDVVVMDLKMPGLDGLDTTRAVRARRPGQRVVLYTAYLDDHIRAEAREAGVALCLGKVEGLPSLERELARLTLDLVGDD
jgi:DNA-binding NarL/FixJ family response regulator